MGNILIAIQSIVENTSTEIIEDKQGAVKNRANQMGAALEEYVKNAFASSFGQDKRTKILAHNQTFSYSGNSNNPPDAILRGSDAIEIKKIESKTTQLQLNSSHPKITLKSNDPKICKKCRSCEEWDEKDMLYVVGYVIKDTNLLKDIFFIYGNLYSDSNEIYENAENIIRENLETIGELDYTETQELGRFNAIDHLGVSDLRVRGMWLLENPIKHFAYLTEEIEDYTLKLVALIPEDKYQTFDNVSEFENFCEVHDISITDEEIEDPQNPSNLINAKLITYYY